MKFNKKIKKMKKIIKPILVALFAFIVNYSNGQGTPVPVNWDLTLKFDSLTNIYTVYGIPDTTFVGVNGWSMATAQITVLLPDSLPDNPLVITSYNFGGWSEQDNCFNGINGGGFDYHAIFTNGQNKPIYKDSIMKFFSFTIPQQCRNFVRLFRNNAEVYSFASGSVATLSADNMDPCNTFSDYNNSIVNGTINNTETYSINQNNYGWNCGTFPSAPLSTLMKDINAKVIDCHSFITWESLNEKEVLGYAIMASKDGSSFTEIAYIDAKGIANHYSFEQVNPSTGVNYYKILIKKNNGSVEYSNVVKVNVYCNGVHYATAFPNPAQNQIDFVINTGSQDENSEVKAQVLDMLGNVVMEQRATIVDSKLNIRFNIQSLANGNYMIRYQNERMAYNGVIKFAKGAK